LWTFTGIKNPTKNKNRRIETGTSKLAGPEPEIPVTGYLGCVSKKSGEQWQDRSRKLQQPDNRGAIISHPGWKFAGAEQDYPVIGNPGCNSI